MKKVLVIDDNIQFLNLVKESLSDICNVECFSEFKTINDILNRMREFLPNIILLDVNLDKFSGIDILREMKKDDKLKKIPVIVLTASDYNSPTEMLVKNEKNVVGFYSKLESIDMIKEKINSIKIGE
ncbi:MAG: response regulator [Elusimicrobiales bacterium]|nr:response regulator [Elusimicrobiales bacterium]